MTNYEKIAEICREHHGIVCTKDLEQKQILR